MSTINESHLFNWCNWSDKDTVTNEYELELVKLYASGVGAGDQS